MLEKHTVRTVYDIQNSLRKFNTNLKVSLASTPVAVIVWFLSIPSFQWGFRGFAFTYLFSEGITSVAFSFL